MGSNPVGYYNEFPDYVFDEYTITEFFVTRCSKEDTMTNIRMHTHNYEAAKEYADKHNYKLYKVVSTRTVEEL